MAILSIPPALRRFTDEQSEIMLDANSIAELLAQIQVAAPKLARSIIEQDGEISPYVNFFIGGKNINTISSNTQVNTNDKIDLISSLVGG